MLSRAKGWRMPENSVKVDRSTRWGNPFVIGQTYPIAEGDLTGPVIGQSKIESAEDAVLAFRSWVTDEMAPPPFDDLSSLRGKHLACWCDLRSPCHADVLLDLANRPDPNASAALASQTVCSASGVRAGDDPQAMPLPTDRALRSTHPTGADQ